MAFMRRNEVLESTGLSKELLYKLVNSGRFPKARYWGRTVVWEERDVNNWIFEERCRREDREAGEGPPKDRS